MTAEMKKHPSYGAISFSRVSSSAGVSMYGSSIKHSNYLMMEITESDVDRSLNTDWQHSGRTLLRARMSSTQFADALTGLNQGGGHPITLEYVKGDECSRPEPPFTSKGKQFKAETEEFFTGLRERAQSLVEQANSVADKPRTGPARELARAVQRLQQHLTVNMDFLHEQFMRQMQRTVLEAKQEVDAHVTSVIAQTGLKELRMPELASGEETQSD